MRQCGFTREVAVKVCVGGLLLEQCRHLETYISAKAALYYFKLGGQDTGWGRENLATTAARGVWHCPPMRRSKEVRIEKKWRDVCSQAVYGVLMAELFGTSGVHRGLQKHPKRAKCHCRWFESILCGGVCVWQCCTSTDGSRQFSFGSTS